MAGARGIDVVFGRLEIGGLRLQRGVLCQRGRHPGIGITLRRQCGLEVVRQALEVGHRGAGDFHQRLVGVLHRVAGEDGVGAGGVVLGAGLVHVGDRRQAHFEALVGEIELAPERGLGGLGGGQGFGGDQHVEIRRRGARDQRIVVGIELEVGRCAQRALRTQRGDLTPVEQHLVGVHAIAACAGASGHARHTAVGQRCTAADLRQQRAAGLHRAFAGRQALRFGDRQRGVVGAGQFVGLDEIGGQQRAGRQGQRERQEQGAAEHRKILGNDQKEKPGTGAAPAR